MGRNTNTSDIQPLDNAQVGQLAQIQGQAVFYNTGSSKWLRTGSYIAASNLTTAMKANLAAQPDQVNAALITANEDSINLAGFFAYCPLPAQRISASSVTVYPSYRANSNYVSILAVTSAGAQSIPLALKSNISSAATGANVVVASNNTTIFAYTPASATTMEAYSTTNGTTWASAALTGLPAFANIPTIQSAYGSGNLCNVGAMGRNTSGHANGSFGVFWCGARFIMVVTDNSLMVTSTSTTGLAWSGNTTVAVLGSAILTPSSITFYRNGNACILGVSNGAVWRYTTDGGVTWADCPTMGGSITYSVNLFQKVNATTAAKLVYCNTTNDQSYWTANTGATWTIRTLPVASSNVSSIAYMGTTALLSGNNGTFRSVDDGATWTQVVFPIGILSQNGVVYADSSRFYYIPNAGKQILTSADAITWTIATIATGTPNVNNNTGGIASFSSNSVLLCNTSSSIGLVYATTDGGVTWAPMTFSAVSFSGTGVISVGDAFITADGLGGGTAVIGGTNGNGAAGSERGIVCSKQTLDAVAQFYRAGPTVSPTNAGAFQYMRVE